MRLVLESVTDGVFFTSPGALPRGRHELPREQVVTAQRERLMIAATELVAANGCRAVGVREIAAHARISRAAFYECFADKDDCFFSAYDRFIGVLLERLVPAVDVATDWQGTVAAVIDTYLATLGSDLVVARAFQVEMDALGRPARERRRLALTALAELLKTRRDERWPGAEELPLTAYIGAVYVVRQLSSDLLDAAPAPALGALAQEIEPWVTRTLAANDTPLLTATQP